MSCTLRLERLAFKLERSRSPDELELVTVWPPVQRWAIEPRLSLLLRLCPVPITILQSARNWQWQEVRSMRGPREPCESTRPPCLAILHSAFFSPSSRLPAHKSEERQSGYERLRDHISPTEPSLESGILSYTGDFFLTGGRIGPSTTLRDKPKGSSISCLSVRLVEKKKTNQKYLLILPAHFLPISARRECIRATPDTRELS